MEISSINSAADARRAFATETGAGAAPASAQPTPTQIKAAAQQFEAIILRQLLTPAIEPLMSHGLGGDNKTNGGGGGGIGIDVDGDGVEARGQGTRRGDGEAVEGGAQGGQVGARLVGGDGADGAGRAKGLRR